MRTPHFSFVVCASATLGLFAPLASAQINYGETSAVGEGWVRSYVQLVGGAPARLGIQFDQAALTAFTTSPATITSLALPATAPAPYNHLAMDWNPGGHPGPGYGVPHFDFHFYFNSPEQVAAIPFDPAPAPMPSMYVAPGYVPDPVVVPQMGQHYLDSLAPEFSDPSAFSQTFFYGYHGGQMTFIEPMITLARLQMGGENILPVRQPALVQTDGFYPTNYGFTGADGMYDVFVSGLEYRAFTPVPEPATWGACAALLLLPVIGARYLGRRRHETTGAGAV